MTKEEKIAALEFNIRVQQRLLARLKGEEVHSANTPPADGCGVGKVWDPILHECVDDIGQ